MLEYHKVSRRVDDKECVGRINILNLQISELIVYPVDTLSQIVLDNIEFALIGAGGKLLKSKQLSQIVPSSEVQPLGFVQHNAKAVHISPKTIDREGFAMSHFCPNGAKQLVGVGIGKDATHKVSYARYGRTIVVEPVRLPVRRIGSLVIIHRKVEVPHRTEVEEVVLTFLI